MNGYRGAIRAGGEIAADSEVRAAGATGSPRARLDTIAVGADPSRWGLDWAYEDEAETEYGGPGWASRCNHIIMFD